MWPPLCVLYHYLRAYYMPFYGLFMAFLRILLAAGPVVPQYTRGPIVGRIWIINSTAAACVCYARCAPYICRAPGLVAMLPKVLVSFIAKVNNAARRNYGEFLKLSGAWVYYRPFDPFHTGKNKKKAAFSRLLCSGVVSGARS